MQSHPHTPLVRPFRRSWPTPGAPLSTRAAATVALGRALEPASAPRACARATLGAVREHWPLLAAACQKAYQHLEVELSPALVALLLALCRALRAELPPAAVCDLLLAAHADDILEDECSRRHYEGNPSDRGRLVALAELVQDCVGGACAGAGDGLQRLRSACAAIVSAAPTPAPAGGGVPDFFASEDDVLDCT